MAWIEYHTALRDHWKIKRLAGILGVEYPYALGVISCLWLWVADYAPDGDINRFLDDEIREAARCGMQKFCVEALKKCELVDERGRINDWHKHGLKLLRSNRKRVAEFRKRKRYGNVTVTPTNLTNQTNQPKDLQETVNIATLVLKKSFLETKKQIYPMLDVEGEIRKCADWMLTKGVKVKSWERTITNWLKRAYDQRGVVAETRRTPKAKPDCDVCNGTGKIPDNGAQCFCVT